LEAAFGADVIDRSRRLKPGERTDPEKVDSTNLREMELLVQARDGNTRAYSQLVEIHQDRIYGLIFRMVREQTLAEELTQDVFIKAFRNLSSFRGDARFSTWVYRIAVNACHDQRESATARNRARETSLDSPELSQLDLPAQSSRPDEAMETDEVVAGFEDSLASLEPMYREAFLLRHQEGLNYGEIAQILGVTLSNAKVRVHRAREMVLEALRSRGFDV
jgi:RNA polymerase sigma-70 factor (ECF subfamily)